MSYDLNRSHWNNNEPTDVDRWLEIYAQDDNLFWATDTGHLMNVIDELIERLQTAKAQAWEEGYTHGLTDMASSMTPNPYRKGEE